MGANFIRRGSKVARSSEHSRIAARSARVFLDCARKHGTMVRMKFGPREPVLISDPALIEQVLVTENRHFVKSRPVQLLQVRSARDW